MIAQEIRVRIAPSPTGDWHLGTARTAIFCWLFARHTQGKFYLRIEDTDQNRLVPGAVDRLLQVLDWLGMTPDPLDDGKPYFVQSENLARYKEIADQLVESGKAYYCFATSEELEAMRKDQESKKLPPRYDNRWGYRDLSFEAAQKRVAAGDGYVIRQKIPTEGTVTIHDAVYGDIAVAAGTLDDNILFKSDGFPTYHLAHVVDDHDMRITHVFRGAEWLPSAPRHVLLYESLGWDLPVYVHVPIILGPDKGKLSKRHGAKPVIEYRENGYLPEGLLNFLSLLGWSTGSDEEVLSPAELIERFDLKRVHSSPAKFDQVRLEWFNAVHIRRLSTEELQRRLLEFWSQHDPIWAQRYQTNAAQFAIVVAALQERITTLQDFAEFAQVFYETPKDYSAELLIAKKQTEEGAREALLLAREVIASPTLDWTHDGLDAALRLAAETKGLKAGEVLWPLRVALTGLPASPGVFEMLLGLVRDESLVRIDYALTLL